MRALPLLLRIAAVLFFLAGALHVVLGLGADALLGANVPPSAMNDPALDSQNRFYGAAFTLYGVLLCICARDLRKYQVILLALLWVFFAAGVARLVSIALRGLPPPPVLGLIVSELLLPPVLALWLRHAVPE